MKKHIMQEACATHDGMNNLSQEDCWVSQSTYLLYILASKMYLQG